MAKERIGKTYEALLKIVLDELHRENKISEHVFWNETPAGISIEPDFLIGPDKDHPHIVFMVTHSGCANNSLMKSWRNLGELSEIKSVISPPPLAINVLFDSIIEKALKSIQEEAFDGQIIIGDKDYHPDLQAWVRENEPNMPVNQEERASYILARSKTDQKLRQLIVCISNDLFEEMNRLKHNHSQLWELEQSRTHISPPNSKVTSLRRGLSKLMIFEDINQGIDLYSGKQIDSKELPDYVYSLGLASKAIAAAHPVDSDILGAVRLISREDIITICESVLNKDTFVGYLQRLRSIQSIDYMGEYIVEYYNKLIDPLFFNECVRRLVNDPGALTCSSPAPSCWPPQDIWLVSYMMELLKEKSGKANGYGSLQLARDTIDNGYGTEADMTSASQFAGGFGFMSWVLRKPSPFRDDLVDGISFTLSKHLRLIGYNEMYKLVTSGKVKRRMISNIVESKLCAYTPFAPLYELLKIYIPECSLTQIKGCFAEKAKLKGNAGNTTVAFVNHTVINWQSAADNPHDKRKELCGRALGIRYTWNENKCVFEPRKNVDKLILLLDGTWTQKDINALIAAGWDEIYYPDEIDKLKAAIV